jgi:hypothetical protein
VKRFLPTPGSPERNDELTHCARSETLLWITHPGIAPCGTGTMRQRTGNKDAPENNLEVSVAAARTTRHCFNDPGYR